MADDYTRANEVFRATELASKKMPINLVGEHVRVYDGVQTLVLSGTSQNLTVPSGATHALIYAEGATVNDFARYWHGTTPTSSIGKKLKDHEELSSAQPSQFRSLNGSGTVTLRVEFYHYA
jgi:hypothetical protein